MLADLKNAKILKNYPSLNIYLHRKRCLHIPAHTKRVVELLQSAAGSPLHLRHDLPAHHDAGGHQEPRARDLSPRDHLLLPSLPSQRHSHDGLHLHDHSHWIWEVLLLHESSRLCQCSFVKQVPTGLGSDWMPHKYMLACLFNVILRNIVDIRTHGQTDTRTHDMLTHWAPVGTKKWDGIFFWTNSKYVLNEEKCLYKRISSFKNP